MISLNEHYLVVWKELEWVKTSFRYAKLESIESIFDYGFDIEGQLNKNEISTHQGAKPICFTANFQMVFMNPQTQEIFITSIQENA